MAAGASQQSGQPDNSMAFFWIIAAVFAAGGVIWYLYRDILIHVYLTIKLWEIHLISLFTNGLNEVQTLIVNSKKESLTFDDVTKIGQAVGEYLRLPLVVILFVLAFMVYLNNSTRIFKRTYSMRDLALEEKRNWPQIVPVVNLSLIKTDIDKGPWAMAMTPMQFCKRYKLLDEVHRKPQEGMIRKEWSRVEVTLRRGAANKLFALQLGPLWQGTNKLSPYIKALFAVFAARFNGDSEAAKKILDQLSISSTEEEMNFAGVDELCKKHENTPYIKRITESHGYVLTAMASMLEAARADGVQASADFLWLKPLDRRLWYVLNTVGRQTPFVEVAGPYAHWIAEKELGRKLLVPMVEEATKALDLALKEILYVPDEPIA